MGNKQRINNKLSDLSCNILKFALNINGQIQQLITETGREDWKKHNWTLCCPQGTHPKYNDMGRLKVKGCKKIHHANKHGCKGERVATLISDKVAFRAKTTSREGEGCHVGIKGQSTKSFLCHLSCLLTNNINSLNLSFFIFKMETISNL